MSPTAAVRGVTAVRDGTPIVWRRWRAGEGLPRVVLLHSLALDGGMWEAAAAALADRADLLALDCRGHGGSGRAAGPYRLDRFAKDVADVMDNLGWHSATIAGCSMGGCVAQAFATAYPSRTDALVLIDTTAWYGPGAPAAWQTRAETARRDGMAALRGFQAERWFTPAFNAGSPEVLARWLGVFEATDPACYAASCAMLGGMDLRPSLARIAAPTLVLVGEEDEATPPAMARALVTGIAGATLRVIPHARHLTPIERPDVVEQAIADLLVGRESDV